MINSKEIKLRQTLDIGSLLTLSSIIYQRTKQDLSKNISEFSTI